MALFGRKKTQASQDEQPVKKADQLKVDKKIDKSKKKEDSASTKSGSQQPRDDKSGDHIAYRVLIHPLLTEKSTIQNSLNQYAFVVGARANKIQIKKAIQEIYHVQPVKIRIINVLGKAVRSGRRGQTTRQKNWKKAIVTIPAGKKIDVYEGV